MPRLAPELQIALLTELNSSLGHIKIKPQDTERDVVLARFFLGLNEFPPLQQEDLSIGRDSYESPVDLQQDVETLISLARSYLDSVYQTSSPEKTDQFITDLNKLNNPQISTTNSPQIIRAWVTYTDNMISAPPALETMQIAVKSTLNQLRFKHKAVLNNPSNKAPSDNESENVSSNPVVSDLIALFSPAAPAPHALDGHPKKKPSDAFKVLLNKFNVPEPSTNSKPLPAGNKLNPDLLKPFASPSPQQPETIASQIKPPPINDEKKTVPEKEVKPEKTESTMSEITASDVEVKADLETNTNATTPEFSNEENRSYNPVTMHQLAMTETVIPVPDITFNSLDDVDEVLRAAHEVSKKKELHAINNLFSQFDQRAILASDPVNRNLELRTRLLNEWNENLLPLQAELLDRIATLEVLEKALEDAKKFAVANNAADTSLLKMIDKRARGVANALDSYKLTLEEFNKIETGLANTNVTVYNDPDYEGKVNVSATVVRKIAHGQNRDEQLNLIREALGEKIQERYGNSGDIGIGLATRTFEYEHAKVDFNQEYSLSAFKGHDTNQVNKEHNDLSEVRINSNLNTVYAMSSQAGTNNFTLEVIDLRQDLDPTHLMVKFATSVHKKLGDLQPLFAHHGSEKELYKLFSQLSKRIPDVKTLENFLQKNLPEDSKISPAKIAKAMHKELMRTLRNPKYPDVPCDEALRLAKNALSNVFDNNSSNLPLIIYGQNAEMRRAMKYTCAMYQAQYKGSPEMQKKYDYYDEQDKFRPSINSGFFSNALSMLSQNKAEKPFLKGLDEAGRRVAKVNMRNDAAELDRDVSSKVGFGEEVMAHKSRSKNLAVLTNTLQSSNNAIHSSSLLRGAISAARSNKRGAERLPEATMVKPSSQR